MLEGAVAAVARRMPGVRIRRGVAVSGLSTNDHGRSGIPHVTGVVTEHDGTIAADLVVDAGGRRSALPAWLEAIDARQPTEEREDSGFVYYGRHFRSPDGSVPPCKNKILTHHDSLSILTLPADNGTWGVGFVASASDKELRSLRDTATWERALAEYPMAAHWMDGEPISDGVAIMAAIEDRYRCYVVDGDPVVTGVVAVGDCVVVHQPVAGARHLDRDPPRQGAARRAARDRHRRPRVGRAALRRVDPQRDRALVPAHADVRPPSPRRNRGGHRRAPVRDRRSRLADHQGVDRGQRRRQRGVPHVRAAAGVAVGTGGGVGSTRSVGPDHRRVGRAAAISRPGTGSSSAPDRRSPHSGR